MKNKRNCITKTLSYYGFTLIELAVVLVVIGLVAGGVLIGQNLVKSAKLRNDIALIKEIELAATTFKLKYSCLPGDCVNVTQFFSNAINGNGNSQVDGLISTYSASSGGFYSIFMFYVNDEITHFMDHLGRAQLMSIEPLDTPGNTDAEITAGELFPRLSTGVPILLGYVNGKHCTGFYSGRANATRARMTGSDFQLGQGYAPIDLKSIDTKIDDGFPKTGRFTGAGWWSYYANGNWKYSGYATQSCIVSESDSILTTDYLSTNQSLSGCQIIYCAKF